jgi:hypothetical protein
MPTKDADPWFTFWPDLVAGLIAGAATGLVVGIVLLVAQLIFSNRANQSADIRAAYLGLIEAVGALTTMTFEGDAHLLGTLAYRMTVLAELVDEKEPTFPLWMEAERQIAISRAADANAALAAASRNRAPGIDEQFNARVPFLEWAQALQSNIRYWRQGKMTAADMQQLEAAARSEVERKGRWNGGAHVGK